MDCNPYLGIAASLACCYLGLEDQERPDKQYRGDAYDSAEPIPYDLFTAMDIFDDAKRLHEALDPEYARVYSIVNRTDYSALLHVLFTW